MKPANLMTDEDIVKLSTREDVQSLTNELIGHASLEILLFTEDLEPSVFDHQVILDSIKDRLIQNRNCVFKILIKDSRKAVQSAHRLVELGRRLSPQIVFKKPSPHLQKVDSTFLIIDNKGYLFRPRADRYIGRAGLDNPLDVRPLKELFDEHWKYAEDDMETRRLIL